MSIQKYDIRRPDGTFEERYWSPLNKPVLNSENEVIFIIHRAEDVTEFVLLKKEQTAKDQITADLQARSIEMEMEILKRSKEIQQLNEELEKKVIERTQQLEYIHKNISDYKFALDESCIVAVTDQKGIIQHANENFCRISKYTEAELIGQDHRIISSGYHSKEFIRNLWTTIANGKVWKGELKNKAKDGTIYWVDTTIVPFLDEHRKPFKYLAIRADITQRKLAEESITDYKFALDESCIVAVTDQKGIIQHANENFCRISKYTEAELIGQDHRIISSGYHSKEFIRNLWTTIANGKVWKGELKNKAKDGTIYWVDTTIVPFLDEHRKPFKYLAIRADITQRKQAEEHILKMNEELEAKVQKRTLELTELLSREQELNELKSRLVSMASHEFRTPLSTILSSVSLIDSYYKEEQKDKRDKHILRVKTSVKSLVDILNDFLSLDKLEEGKMEIVQKSFDLHEFSSDIVEEVHGMLKKGQQIHFSYVGETEIVQDKKILKNVFLNLLSNAIKYSAEGKEIFFNISVHEDSVSVTVVDKGIGIPESEQKNLFEKFYRAKNAANIQGTGLGLNIVKKYVELLDGTIHFTSILEEGTTFTLKFPKTIIQ